MHIPGVKKTLNSLLDKKWRKQRRSRIISGDENDFFDSNQCLVAKKCLKKF